MDGGLSYLQARRLVSIGVAVALATGSIALTTWRVARGAATAVAPAVARHYPGNIPAQVAHPGTVLVGFRTPVQSQGNRFAHDSRGSASSQDLAAINQTLTGLGAVSIRHLFTNIPASQLNAARAKAQAATHAYVTDFTQVYQVSYDPAINPGLAANRLAGSPLVGSAMPDFVLQSPSQGEAEQPSASEVQQELAAPAAAGSGPALISGTSLPANSAYRSDAQSYLDAASDNVTGAAAMIAQRFGQQPGEGEVVTNISLGDVNDNSTVLQAGQRYIVEAGYPRIPVWLSSQSCTTVNGGQDCSVVLDPAATTQDEQGDFLEVNLDFGVMAPPPLGDPRVVNPPPAGLGELLGEAYGASYRLINPLTNSTPNFFAAFLGAAFLQAPAANVITASIGEGFSIGGFSDYFFEQEAMIHDAVSTVVNGADIFVSISAGDGQTQTQVAMNPDGLTGQTNVTTDPNRITDINEQVLWADPNYSYGLTDEPQFVIDSGANDAGGDTLNDVYNNAPWNSSIPASVSHSQHTTETRWTGQQQFHSGNGSRVNISAPADDVLMLAQVEQNGVPVNPVATFPRLIGGTSASSPEIAGAAAVVGQVSRLLGLQLSATQVRNLLASTARSNRAPAFDLSNANVGPNLDLTRAVQTLFDQAHAKGTSQLVRMTVAERKAVLTPTDVRSSFWSDTTQDPATHTATVDLSQGLLAPSSRTNETVGSTGDNVFAPITFAVDGAFVSPDQAHYQWSLSLGGNAVPVPQDLSDPTLPYVRLLPSEIFGLLGAPVTAATDRVVTVTARSGAASIATAVTFRGQADASHAHAVPPSFNPVFQPAGPSASVHISFDLRGVRDSSGGQVDGGVLLVSDIDRAVPQAFPDLNLDAHGFKVTLPGLVGSIDLPASDFPRGAGTYGIALRGTKGGQEVADSTSFWLPLRYTPDNRERLPATPKIQAQASVLNGTAPLFYEAADTEPGGSTEFAVAFDVRSVPGAKGALIEFSAPTHNFAQALFVTGNFSAANAFVNNFTNINGDRLDTGDGFGQPGETAHVQVQGTSGEPVLDGAAIGLSIPAGFCDSTYAVRVFATDAAGNIVGVASDPSILSYADFSRAAACGL